MVMAKTVVELLGKELGQHGPNIYYREFSVSINDIKRNYKLGEFYFVRKQQSHPICIAELQLIWLNSKDGKKYATAKLYFRPEDTKLGRLAEHGEDELIEADKHIPMHCGQMPFWECNATPSFGKYVYEGLNNIDSYMKIPKNLHHEQSCICGTTNGHIEKYVRAPVKVLSFPAYCRYMSCVKLLATECDFRRDIMLARGAIEIDCSKMKIFFCRFKFQHDDIEDFSLDENLKLPVFKGRPRKRKHNQTTCVAKLKRAKTEKQTSRNHIEPNSQALLCQTYKIVATPKNNTMREEMKNHYAPEEKGETNAENEHSSNVTRQSSSFITDVKVITADTDQKCLEMIKPVKYSQHDETYKLTGKTSVRNGIVKRKMNNDAAPSELVKKGKTGTILDESFFREMKSQSEGKLSEGIDNEKMKKILKDACKDEEKFKCDLFMFMKQRGTPIIYVPKIGYTRVDLPKLFFLVVSNGGYKQVTINHRWKKVYDDMLLATTITSAATCMRRHYERLLLPFEKHLRVKHKQDAALDKTYFVTSQTNQPLVLTIKTNHHETSKPIVTSSCVAVPLNVPDDASFVKQPCLAFSTSNADEQSKDEIPKMYVKSELNVAREHIINPVADIITSNSSSLKMPHSAADIAITNVMQPLTNATCFVSTYNSITTTQSMSTTTTLHSTNVVATGTMEHALNSVSLLDNCKTDILTKPIVLLSRVISNTESISKSGDTQNQPMKTDKYPNNNGTFVQDNCTQNNNNFDHSHSLSNTVPLSTASTKAMPATVYHTEVSVITKARPMQQDGCITTMSPMQASSNVIICNNTVPVKKRRGRPPKYLKDRLQLPSTSSQGMVHNVVCSNIGNSVLVNTTMHSKEAGKIQQTEVSNSRKTMKNMPVKVYEYVMATTAMQAKLVKHKHGIISLPKLPILPNVTSNYSPNPSDICSSQKSSINETKQGGLLSGHMVCTATKPNVIILNQNKMNTIKPNMPIPVFSSFGSEQNYNNCSSISANIGERNARMATDRLSNESIITSVKMDANINDKNRRKEDGMKPEGPPPLIPIHEEASNDLDQTAITLAQNDNKSHPKTAANVIHQTVQVSNTENIRPISLMSDLKRMKDSFDINSLMKPFSKEIDQSLEVIRRAAGASIDQEAAISSASRDFLALGSTRVEHELKSSEHSQIYHVTPVRPNEHSSETNYQHADFDRNKKSDVHAQSRLASSGSEPVVVVASTVGRHQFSSKYEDHVKHHIKQDEKHDTCRSIYNTDAPLMPEYKDNNHPLLYMTSHRDAQRHMYIPDSIRLHGAMNNSAEHVQDHYVMHQHQSQHNENNSYISHDQQNMLALARSGCVENRSHDQYKAVNPNERHLETHSETIRHDSMHNNHENRDKKHADKVKDFQLSSYCERNRLNNQKGPNVSGRSQCQPDIMHVVDSHVQQQQQHSLRNNEMQHKGGHTENDLLHGEKLNIDLHRSLYHFKDHHPYRLSNSVHHTNYHQIMASSYPVKECSVALEREDIKMADHSSPQHSWYDLHRQTSAAATNNVFYWHQQVHH